MILRKLQDAHLLEKYQKWEDIFARFQMHTSSDLNMAHLNPHSLSFRDSLDGY